MVGRPSDDRPGQPVHLLTIDDVQGGSIGARLANGAVLHLGRAARAGTIEHWLPTDMVALLEAGDVGLDVVRAMVARGEAGDDTHAIVTNHVALLAPVPRPRFVLAAGLAYKSHLAEMSGTPAPAHPTGFMKTPTSIAGPDQGLHLPHQANSQVDYEGELACIFGRKCHAVAESDALSYLAGYTVANDFSARDWVRPVWAATQPWEARLTWEVNIMGKQFDGFTALGPVMTTADEIPDPATLTLSTRINGETMQHAPVSDLIFPIAAMIAHFSRWYTFMPGDVMLTGTPAGVGVSRNPPVFVKPGDVVEVEITNIGVLETRVRA
jgi:acylpyruvate hydrolase